MPFRSAGSLLRTHPAGSGETPLRRIEPRIPPDALPTRKGTASIWRGNVAIRMAMAPVPDRDGSDPDGEARDAEGRGRIWRGASPIPMGESRIPLGMAYTPMVMASTWMGRVRHPAGDDAHPDGKGPVWMGGLPSGGEGPPSRRVRCPSGSG